jgi:hypothetical protein
MPRAQPIAVPRAHHQFLTAADRERGRHRRRDESGHFCARGRRDHAGEAEGIAAVVDIFVRAMKTSDFDRRLQLPEAGLARNLPLAGRDFRRPAQMMASTFRRDFAADLLQMQQNAIITSNAGCRPAITGAAA